MPSDAFQSGHRQHVACDACGDRAIVAGRTLEYRDQMADEWRRNHEAKCSARPVSPPPTCSTCRWWRDSQGEIAIADDSDAMHAFGAHCKRRAPVARTDTDQGRWPLTKAHDFCGDHEARSIEGATLHRAGDGLSWRANGEIGRKS